MMLILLSTSIIKFLASPWIILTLDPPYLLFSGFIRSLSYSNSVIFPEKFNFLIIENKISKHVYHNSSIIKKGEIVVSIEKIFIRK